MKTLLVALVLTLPMLFSGCATGPQSSVREAPHVIRIRDLTSGPIVGAVILPAAVKTSEPYSLPASDEKGEINLSAEHLKILGIDKPEGALLYIRKEGYEFAEIKLDKDTSWPASVILRPVGESQAVAKP